MDIEGQGNEIHAISTITTPDALVEDDKERSSV